MRTNLILDLADSYKHSHKPQHPVGTTRIYSYIEARGGEYNKSVFFGLQAFLKRYMTNPITMEDINEAEVFLKAHGQYFDRTGWEYILDVHDGYLPLSISAVPEGTVMPIGLPLVTVFNTDSEVPWLTSFCETAILRAVWYGTTVCTQSWHIKQIILDYLEKTGTPDSIGFKLHDFGARGVSSQESAEIGGAAHLVNFMGTDTIAGALHAMEYYNAESPVGFSIPAAEHSTTTIMGEANEVHTYRHILDTFLGEGKMVAVVSDSYNIMEACRIWGKELKEQIVNSGGTLVVRPDSGDPVEVVSSVIKKLAEYFGTTTNEKGYKVLPDCIRVIQGDGINAVSIKAILARLEAIGYSADNIAFGMGGALLQGITRDTMQFAMKCSAAKVKGTWRKVFKDPVTDSGKRSKKGLVTTLHNEEENSYLVYDRLMTTTFSKGVDMLEEVFFNGNMIELYTFDEIRTLTNKG